MCCVWWHEYSFDTIYRCMQPIEVYRLKGDRLASVYKFADPSQSLRGCNYFSLLRGAHAKGGVLVSALCNDDKQVQSCAHVPMHILFHTFSYCIDCKDTCFRTSSSLLVCGRIWPHSLQWLIKFRSCMVNTHCESTLYIYVYIYTRSLRAVQHNTAFVWTCPKAKWCMCVQSLICSSDLGVNIEFYKLANIRMHGLQQSKLCMCGSHMQTWPQSLDVYWWAQLVLFGNKSQTNATKVSLASGYFSAAIAPAKQSGAYPNARLFALTRHGEMLWVAFISPITLVSPTHQNEHQVAYAQLLHRVVRS